MWWEAGLRRGVPRTPGAPCLGSWWRPFPVRAIRRRGSSPRSTTPAKACTVHRVLLNRPVLWAASLRSMASTFKVPLAVQLLRRVDAGEISLDQMHTMQPGDYHPGAMPA